jgi:catechol 2,3-dioxygenase-like lactoylglutathione lyase family enzyme
MQERDMPVIKVTDIAYVRVRVPDLDRAEQFFADFGLTRVDRTSHALYMRGTGTDHHVYVAELGEPKFLALAFKAATEADLHALSRIHGASAVEPIQEPGGGKRVIVKDPDGNQIEIVHGIDAVPGIAHEVLPMNDAANALRRAGTLSRHTRRAAKVVRIGHAVLKSHTPRPMVQWFQDTLGLLCSDEVFAPDGTLALSFNRVDRGDEYVDHHVLLIDTGPKGGLNHVAYEIHDIDDLMLGHDHLQSKGYENVWGIGRHVYGGQLFDYWMDPWDFMYEHWTDTDRVNARFKGVLDGTPESAAGPWGPQVPERFLFHAHE